MTKTAAGHRAFTSWATACCLALLVAIVPTTTKAQATQGQASGRILFEAAGAADAAPGDRTARRKRRVRANLRALEQSEPTGVADVVTLNLFDDVQLRARRSSPVERTRLGGSVWKGRLLDVHGEATLAIHGDVMAGTVFAGARVFEIIYKGGGQHEVREIEPSAFPTDDPIADLPAMAPDPQAAAVDAAVAAEIAGDPASQIDVMVIWTPAARAAAGGTSAIQSLATLAITTTNTAYANSGVLQRLRLVYAGEVTYTEVDPSTDLTRLATGADGFLDGVHTLRNTYGADVVTMFGEGYFDAGVCGLGYVMTTVSTGFASSAFNLVDRVCGGANLTTAHELGHNMGLQHDPANAISTPAYSYAYGYQHPAGAFRTVMAYACPTGPCPRVMHFANPSVNYNGMPTGTASQNTALALNNTAASVANFRQAVTGSCTYSLSGSLVTIGNGTSSSSVAVSTGAGCTWTATSNASWLTITSGASGTGPGTVAYTVAANTTPTSRTAVITVGGKTLVVSQAAAACTYTLSSNALVIPRTGGTASVVVTASSLLCSWTIVKTGSWITLSGSTSRVGSATVTVSAPAYSGTPRTGSLTIAGQVVTVTQLGKARNQALDFNVDGTGDLLLYDEASGAWQQELSAAGGFQPGSSGSWGTGWQILPADFNADDRSDLFLYNTSTGSWRRLITQSDGTYSSTDGQWIGGWAITVLDLTGDGRSDLFLYNSQTGQWFQCLTQTGADPFSYRNGSWAPGWTVTRAAFNVDGRDDLFLYNGRSTTVDSNSGRWFRVVTQSDLSFAYFEGEQRWVAGWTVLPADFTGDGRSEVLLTRPDGLWFMALFGASGTTYRSGNWVAGYTAQRAEFNGDGRADVFLYNRATGEWSTAVTQIDGTFAFSSGVWLAGWQSAVTDLNNDGLSDVALYHPQQGLCAKVVTSSPGVFAYVIGNVGPGWTMIGGHVVLP